MVDIKQELKNLPDKPGVYIMKNKYKDIIYIGKAKVLKNRVRQYFQSSRNHSSKVKSMVTNISEFEYIITDSELEALILECNLIKKHKPKYNVLLKDDKHYPYIKITMQEEYPRVVITRKLKKDGSKYFGPYTSSYAVKETIEIIHKIFMVRTCNKKLPTDIGKERPCLNYHIKKCLAPCIGNVGKEEYMMIIKDVCAFLNGKQDEVIKRLKKEMYAASDKMNFERAGDLRDKIIAIEKINEKQKIIFSTLSDQDIIAFASNNDETCVQVFFIRGGKLIGRENFMLDSTLDMEKEEIMSTFVKQFYNVSSYVPKEVILQEDIDEANIIQSWLTNKRGSKVYVKVPVKGEKQKLVKMVQENAKEALQQFEIRVKQNDEFVNKSLSEFKKYLLLDDIPKRIEAYDISNISGMQSVGSMVVFVNAKPSNKDYRKFKIKSVIGPNDYESMKEVLFRRFKRAKQEIELIKTNKLDKEKAKFYKLPDLIFVDGGIGHLNCAKEILDELNVDIPIFGMVKDDRHRTRGIVSPNGEIKIPITSYAFRLIASIQDEAHRVAITYHRSLRNTKNIKSELENINGIGKVRRKNLLKYFKTIKKIRQASMEELEKVEGMDKRSAENVYNYFRKKRIKNYIK